MIPKKIHYCWFGGNPLPKLAKKCIKSWKKHCPEYEIIRWDEKNVDISSCPLYVRQAYEAKKWAFVTDYIRLKVVSEHGGIYLDTDVELLKNPEHLLDHQAYFGFEAGEYIATGLGFGAEPNAPILRELMDDYADIPFILPDGSYDLESCPVRNTRVLVRHGLRQDDTRQVLPGDILILPSVYLCPMRFWSGVGQITEETVSVHWYSASWQSEEERKQHARQARSAKWAKRKEYLAHIPNHFVMAVLGKKGYEKLKRTLKK